MGLILREDFSIIDEDVEIEIIDLEETFEDLMVSVNNLYLEDINEDFVIEAMSQKQTQSHHENIINNIERVVDTALSKIDKEKEEYDLIPPQENAMNALLSVVKNDISLTPKLQSKILTLRQKTKDLINTGNVDIVDTYDWVNRVSRNMSWVDKENIQEDYVIENTFSAKISSMNNEMEDQYEKTLKFSNIDNKLIDKIASGGIMSSVLSGSPIGSMSYLFSTRPENDSIRLLDKIMSSNMGIHSILKEIKEMSAKLGLSSEKIEVAKNVGSKFQKNILDYFQHGKIKDSGIKLFIKFRKAISYEKKKAKKLPPKEQSARLAAIAGIVALAKAMNVIYKERAKIAKKLSKGSLNEDLLDGKIPNNEQMKKHIEDQEKAKKIKKEKNTEIKKHKQIELELGGGTK